MPLIERLATTRSVGKATWAIGGTLLTLFKFPLRLGYFIPKQLRQHPEWTYRQAIMNEVIRAFLDYSSILETRTHLSLERGTEKELFVKDCHFAHLTLPSLGPSG